MTKVSCSKANRKFKSSAQLSSTQKISSKHISYCICGKDLLESEIYSTLPIEYGSIKKPKILKQYRCSKICEILSEIETHAVFMPSTLVISHLIDVHGYPLSEISDAISKTPQLCGHL